MSKEEIFGDECVYYYEGVMCYYEIPFHCEEMKDKLSLKLFRQKTTDGFVYSFYEVE